MASFDSVGNMGKYEEPIVILRKAECVQSLFGFFFWGGGIKYFACFRNLTPNFRDLVRY